MTIFGFCKHSKGSKSWEFLRNFYPSSGRYQAWKRFCLDILGLKVTIIPTVVVSLCNDLAELGMGFVGMVLVPLTSYNQIVTYPPFAHWAIVAPCAVYRIGNVRRLWVVS